jgi:hypothetical protein
MPQLQGGWNSGEMMTLVDVLRTSTERSPDSLLVDFSGAEYTYADVW